MDNYIYVREKKNDGALLLGYGWIYNHSYSPNAQYKRNFERKVMVYRAIKNIKARDEITVNHNGDPNNQDPIDWIDAKE